MIVSYMHNAEFIDYLRAENKRIICFGVGSIANNIMSEINPYVECFMDNSKEIGDKYIYMDKEYTIYSPEQITNCADVENCVFLIASRHRRSMVQQLMNLAPEDSECVLVYEYLGVNVHGSLDEETWYNKRFLNPTIKNIKKKMKLHGFDETTICDKLTEMESDMGFYGEKRKLVIPKMVFLSTTKCTLRCQGCIGLIPCFDNPKDFEVEDIKRDIDRMLDVVDEIMVAEIGGGEPFMYHDFDELLKYMLAQDKITSIIIPTNATLIPSQERTKLLQNKKVSLHVSDYGNLVQLAKFISFLEDNHIVFHFVSDQKWIDAGDGETQRHKSYGQLCMEYQNCFQSSQCKTVFNGRLYPCARAARDYQLLNDVELRNKDSISIYDTDNLREDIINFYLREMAYACDYCDCQNAATGEIEAGLQPNPLWKKSKYTLIKRED